MPIITGPNIRRRLAEQLLTLASSLTSDPELAAEAVKVAERVLKSGEKR